MNGSINDDRVSLRGRPTSDLMGDEGNEVLPSPPKRKRSSDSSSSAVIRGLRKPSKGGVEHLVVLGDSKGMTGDRDMVDHRTSSHETTFLYVVRKVEGFY